MEEEGERGRVKEEGEIRKKEGFNGRMKEESEGRRRKEKWRKFGVGEEGKYFECF